MVAVVSFKEVVVEMAIGLAAPDYRLDGGAPPAGSRPGASNRSPIRLCQRLSPERSWVKNASPVKCWKFGSFTQRAQTPSSDRPWMCLSNNNPIMNRADTAGRPAPVIRSANPGSIDCQLISPASRTSSWRMLMICSNRKRNRPRTAPHPLSTQTRESRPSRKRNPKVPARNPRSFRFVLLRQRDHVSDI